MKHTKGPWTVIDNGDFSDASVESSNGPVAVVGSKNGLANAQLIAAAPEMLEVLKQLQSLEEGQPISHDLIAEIDEVIKKAKGQE